MNNPAIFKNDSCTIRIHNGDCMDAMAGMRENEYELSIVDPPYGIGMSGGG